MTGVSVQFLLNYFLMESNKVEDVIPESFKEKWGRCKEKVKAGFTILAAERKNGYSESKHFKYYNEWEGFYWTSPVDELYGKRSCAHEITMYPNGVCTIYDQIGDPDAGRSYIGVYFLNENKIDAKVVAYYFCNEYCDSDQIDRFGFDVVDSKKIKCKSMSDELELC